MMFTLLIITKKKRKVAIKLNIFETEGGRYNTKWLYRIDYTPENCRWTTKLENSRKTRQVKLNEAVVKEIRYGTKYKDYTIQELANEFEVSWGTIQAVKQNKTWKGV